MTEHTDMPASPEALANLAYQNTLEECPTCGDTFDPGDLIETRDPLGVRFLCGDCWSTENLANERSHRGTALGYGRE